MCVNSIRCYRLLRKVGVKAPFFKTLRKRFILPIRIKVGRRIVGVLIASYNSADDNVVMIEALWYKKDVFAAMKRDLFSMFFNALIFSHNNIFKLQNISKLTIIVKLQPYMELEDFMALDLHGFHPDPSATLDILDFQKPWREKEDLQYLVYSRSI